jgi:cyclopropane-fatty-acyl-phospholipid synthase
MVATEAGLRNESDWQSYGRFDCDLPNNIKSMFARAMGTSPVPVAVNFWNQHELRVAGQAQVTFSFRHPGVLRSFLHSYDRFVALVECWLKKDFEFKGRTDDVLTAIEHFANFGHSKGNLVRAWFDAFRLPKIHSLSLPRKSLDGHDLIEDRIAIQHHYDVSNEFYKSFLDPMLVYSCGYFAEPDCSLAEAQQFKLDLICKKLLLKPGDRLLDIGCGWGALLRHAATNYGVQAFGITLSEEQYQYNVERIKADESANIQVMLCDYRELSHHIQFNKIVSVGMIEHVGIANYPEYFQRIHNLLAPGGLFLNHGIVTNTEFNSAGFRERFIHSYIFPNGELSSLTDVVANMKQTNFEVVDVDCWRPHYAKTLRAWAHNLESNYAKALQASDEQTIRLWLMYLYGSARGFENNDLSIYQVLCQHINDKYWRLPSNRKGWLA